MDNIRNLERRFSNEIKKHLLLGLPKICNSFLEFKESSYKEDTELSFDLVFNLTFTVSVRIRRFDYIKFNDLTIRSKTKFGFKTEIDKIIEGKAQVYFYAYMNKEETELVKIRIVDVDAIRAMTDDGVYTSNKNTDGTEFFSYSFPNIKKYNGNIYQFDK